MKINIELPSWAVKVVLLTCLCLAVVTGGLLYILKYDLVGYDEVLRSPSPDGAVDAVWVSSSAGATTGFSYGVYIVPHGEKFQRSMEPVLRTFKPESWSLNWSKPALLEFSYKKAYISDFRNYCWVSRKDGSRYRVEVKLKPLSDDSIPY